ncbi:MAG: hypothetical protein RBS88_00230 [Spongiibacteraceae bacterium]|jgi:hypothetical protein|nr:hypothetical protein [Spongiibacteraceae bacterium]
MIRITTRGVLHFVVMLSIAGCDATSAQSGQSPYLAALQLQPHAVIDRNVLAVARAQPDTALQHDPESVKVLQTRLSINLRTRRLSDALTDLDRLIATREETGDRLLRCFIVERLKAKSEEEMSQCYDDVIMRYEKHLGSEASLDLNYLVALRMADDPRFEPLSKAFIRAQPEVQAEYYEFILFQPDRNAYLEMIQPSPQLP